MSPSNLKKRTPISLDKNWQSKALHVTNPTLHQMKHQIHQNIDWLSITSFILFAHSNLLKLLSGSWSFFTSVIFPNYWIPIKQIPDQNDAAQVLSFCCTLTLNTLLLVQLLKHLLVNCYLKKLTTIICYTHQNYWYKLEITDMEAIGNTRVTCFSIINTSIGKQCVWIIKLLCIIWWMINFYHNKW